MLNEAMVYVVDDDRVDLPSSLSALPLRWPGVADVPVGPGVHRVYFPWTGPHASCWMFRLPGPSGLDLQSTLVQARPDIPIVFLTGYGSVPTTVRAMQGGAVDFLEKPFNDQQLLDCVQRALRPQPIPASQPSGARGAPAPTEYADAARARGTQAGRSRKAEQAECGRPRKRREDG